MYPDKQHRRIIAWKVILLNYINLSVSKIKSQVKTVTKVMCQGKTITKMNLQSKKTVWLPAAFFKMSPPQRSGFLVLYSNSAFVSDLLFL